MQHLLIVHLSKLQSLMLIPPIKQDQVATILPVKNNYIMKKLCEWPAVFPLKFKDSGQSQASQHNKKSSYR